MKKTILSIAVTTLLCLVYQTGSLAGGYRVIDGAELKKMMKEEKPVIVDVREPELFSAGHIPGAVNIPYDSAKERILKELSPGDTIVFVCHGGPMGDELAEVLVKEGYPRVYNLRGGMRWWRGPLER